MHHFDIHMDVDCDKTRVLMDGKPLEGVHAFRVECSKGGVTRITLEMSGTSNIYGQAQVWVKDEALSLVNQADAADSRANAADHRATEADDRATAAEARADAAESRAPFDPSTGTLAYIVPVPKNEGFKSS